MDIGGVCVVLGKTTGSDGAGDVMPADETIEVGTINSSRFMGSDGWSPSADLSIDWRRYWAIPLGADEDGLSLLSWTWVAPSRWSVSIMMPKGILLP